MSDWHKVDQSLVALTTKEPSYIIVLGIVISILPISSTGFTANEMKLYLYWHWSPSTSKCTKSSRSNGTTIVQIPNVNPCKHMMEVWMFSIYPGAPSTQVMCTLQCSPTQGECRSEYSATPLGKISHCKKVHEGSHIQEDSFTNIIWWEVLDGSRCLDTIQWSSG